MPFFTRRAARELRKRALNSVSVVSGTSGSNPLCSAKESVSLLRQKLIKIGAKVVSYGYYVTFQMALDRQSSDCDRYRAAVFRPSLTQITPITWIGSVDMLVRGPTCAYLII